MLKLIDRIFTDKHANHAAIGDNYLLMLMYRFAYPFAYVLHALRLTPNQITTLSVIFAVLAFIQLIVSDSWLSFSVCWSIAILLDFCDGTVARLSNRVSKNSFRYDQMSDLFKISLVILGVALRYGSTWTWVLALSTVFLFLYNILLYRELWFATRNYGSDVLVGNAVTKNDRPPSPQTRLRDRFRIAGWLVQRDKLVKVVKTLYVILFTTNGHTLLVFYLFPLGEQYASIALFYLILLTMIGIHIQIRALIKIPR